MPEISELNIRDIKFTRDTKVDYQNGSNAVINCIFQKWDTDRSGDFNDEEWALYEKYLEKAEQRKKEQEEIKVNKKVVTYYEKKLAKLQTKYETLNKNWKLIDFSAWEKLQKFEENHPQIMRNGYKDKKEVPKGALKIDISAMGMGIYDEKTKSFTGKCYEKGYIAGLETLTETERKEYLELLDKSLKSLERIKELQGLLEKYDKQFDKYKALQDMASAGMIDKIGSPDYEDQAYTQYTEIRNNSNPFYQQMRELEAKMTSLRLKGEQTEEDKRLIEQYRIQIEQLRNASFQWSITDTDNKQKIENGTGFRLTNLSETLTYTDSPSKELSDIHSVGASYSTPGLSLNSSFTKTEKYTFEPEDDMENVYEASLGCEYKRNDFSVSSNSSLSSDDSMVSFNQSLDVGYKKFNLNLNESIMRMEGTKDKTYTTTVSLSHTAGNFTNTASTEFTESENTYSLSSNANFNVKLSEAASLGISPSVTSSYNDDRKSYTVAPSANVSLNYNKKEFGLNMNLNESYYATMCRDSETALNHQFSASGNISYKGLSTNLRFNDMDNSFSHSNTYGAGIQYRTKKAGTFGVEYSYMKFKSKFAPKNVTETNTVTFKYSAPLDWTRKKK